MPVSNATRQEEIHLGKHCGFLEISRDKDEINLNSAYDGYANLNPEQTGELIAMLTRLKAEAEQWRRENQ